MAWTLESKVNPALVLPWAGGYRTDCWATDAAMNAGGLFDEIGKKTVTDDGANAYDKMRASATALVANGQATTIEKAMDVVMKSNPKLYQDYLAGN